MINVPIEGIREFAERWSVQELALFGSAVREDFTSSSDVDVLIQFRDDAPWTLWDIVRMKSELEQLFGRRVDLVEKSGLRNPYRRENIIRSARVVYAA